MAKAPILAPGLAGFDRPAREGNLVPVSCEVLADLDTPISAFMRLRHLPHAFLLESAEGSEKVARYSFLGAQPRLTLRASLDRVEVTEGGTQRPPAPDPPTAAYEDVTTFPAVREDLAVVLSEEVTAADVIAVVRAAGAPLVRSVEVFDVYRDADGFPNSVEFFFREGRVTRIVWRFWTE